MDKNKKLAPVYSPLEAKMKAINEAVRAEQAAALQSNKVIPRISFNDLVRAIPGEQYWDQQPMASFYYHNPYTESAFMQREAAAAAVLDVAKPSTDMLQRVEVGVQNLDLNEPRTALAIEAESMLGYNRLRKEVKAESPLQRALAKLEIEFLDLDSVDKYKAQMVAHMKSAGKMGDPTWRLTALTRYTQPIPEFVLAKCIEIKKELPAASFYVEQLHEDPFMIVTDGVTLAAAGQIRSYPDSAFYFEVWDEPRFEGRA